VQELAIATAVNVGRSTNQLNGYSNCRYSTFPIGFSALAS